MKTYFAKGSKNLPGGWVHAIRLESPSLDSRAQVQQAGQLAVALHACSAWLRSLTCSCRVDANPGKSDDLQELCNCVQG